jgi:hypothetical protein
MSNLTLEDLRAELAPIRAWLDGLHAITEGLRRDGWCGLPLMYPRDVTVASESGKGSVFTVRLPGGPES